MYYCCLQRYFMVFFFHRQRLGWTPAPAEKLFVMLEKPKVQQNRWRGLAGNGKIFLRSLGHRGGEGRIALFLVGRCHFSWMLPNLVLDVPNLASSAVVA